MLSRFAKLIRQHPRQVYRNIDISCIYVPPLQHLLPQLSVYEFQMASGGNELISSISKVTALKIHCSFVLFFFSSRLGCQIEVTEDMDGLVLNIPISVDIRGD